MNVKAKHLVAGAVAGVLALGAITFTAAGPAFSQFMGDVTATVHVRKDVKDMSAAEKREFVNAVLALKSTPSPYDSKISWYDQFVTWHRDAFDCDEGWNQGKNWAGAAHNSPTFLPWHRQYLSLYEEALRSVSGNPNLTLPYWDWTDPESTKAVFAADFMGGDGNPDQRYAVTDGPFRKGKWTITVKDPAELFDYSESEPQTSFLRRNFGAFAGSTIGLPTRAQVVGSLGVGHYDHKPYDASSPLDESFRNTVEGWREATPATCDDRWIDVSQEKGSPHEMHNSVHIYVGGIWDVNGRTAEGTMAYNTSPNDPVFFIHHANVDRIFAAWEMTTGGKYLPRKGAPDGWNATDTMWPWFDRTINSWFGTLRNGYRYEELPR